MPDKEKYADKINKLLRKAESTNSPQEAEALVEKAQTLMTEYAITNAMLEETANRPREEIVELKIDFEGTYPYQKATKLIGFAVLKQNDCDGFYRNLDDLQPPRQEVVIMGYESDARRVQLLATSLQLQCISAMQSWWKEVRKQTRYTLMDKGQQLRERRQFIYGFARGLEEQLERARKSGEKQAAKAEAERQDTSVEEATASMALVIRSRKDQVKDWVDEKYGTTLRHITTNYTPGTAGAGAAGQAAGLGANTDVRPATGEIES